MVAYGKCFTLERSAEYRRKSRPIIHASAVPEIHRQVWDRPCALASGRDHLQQWALRGGIRASERRTLDCGGIWNGS